MNALRQLFKQLFPGAALRYRAYKELIRNEDSYLYETGWMASLAEFAPQRSDGQPIPWMNYPMISLLEERLAGDMSLFEFGSGFSTRFFASRVKDVISVEYDRAWLQMVQATLPANAELIYQAQDAGGSYCRTIDNAGRTFDVVIVDGRDRVNCVKRAIPALSSRGLILLDDSQREDYREGIDYAMAKGFRVLHLQGLKATGTETDRSTLIYRDGNCFSI
ncbi:MAG: FkbM family methyltransferase [Gammaproteobacteria bacterium]|nr:class I SAM-dependent methyltransferase [Gammaproteobacteria bacterium]NND53344.1 FkbM family methyltransferase [Gammaproteobacteria bacterium]